MTFQDGGGHERYDVAMLDPGASAFLCGYGPAADTSTTWPPTATPSTRSSSTAADTNFTLVVTVRVGAIGSWRCQCAWQDLTAELKFFS